MIEILEGRKNQIHETGQQPVDMACEQAQPGRLGEPAGLRLLRLAGGALPDRRRPAPRPRPDRLRGLHLGHPRVALLGPGTAPAQLLHRPAREGRDLRRRGQALRVAHRTDRPLPAQGGLRLLHLHRRADRRRRGGRLPPRGGRERHSRAARPLRRLQGHEEGRLPRGLRRPRHAGRHRVHRRHQPAAASTSSAISTWPAKRG